MFNPDLTKILHDDISRYSLVAAVAKRARELTSDDTAKEMYGTKKAVSYALDEFLDGKLEIIDPVENE